MYGENSETKNDIRIFCNFSAVVLYVYSVIVLYVMSLTNAALVIFCNVDFFSFFSVPSKRTSNLYLPSPASQYNYSYTYDRSIIYR